MPRRHVGNCATRHSKRAEDRSLEVRCWAAPSPGSRGSGRCTPLPMAQIAGNRHGTHLRLPRSRSPCGRAPAAPGAALRSIRPSPTRHSPRSPAGRRDGSCQWHRECTARHPRSRRAATGQRNRGGAEDSAVVARPQCCGCDVHQHAGSMALRGGSLRAVRAMFSAISRARASSMPSVQPETCGVMITFGSVWNGCVAGGAGSVEVG